MSQSPLGHQDKTTNLHSNSIFVKQFLLGETSCDLLSINKTIDWPLKEPSLIKSIRIGARVAPFPPVGFSQHNTEKKTIKTMHATKLQRLKIKDLPK